MDSLDFRIIELLQEDGRRSNTDIARRLNVSEATVRKRIDNLITNGTIQIVAWADPMKIGFPVWADIQIQAELGRVDEIAKKLASFPEIYFAGLLTGAFDVAASAFFRSHEHLYEFLTRRLGSVPGIHRTVTSTFLKVVKRSFKYGVSQDGGSANSPLPVQPTVRPWKKRSGRNRKR